MTTQVHAGPHATHHASSVRIDASTTANTDAHTTVRTSVDVTYTARFRVGNGGWQDIPETVTITGPAGALRISEATVVLSGER